MSDEAVFDEVWARFWDLLYSDLNTENDYPNSRPLLAHYTSLENIENILRSEQIWLSNPLLMNDLEEVRFGVLNGLEIIRSHEQLRASLESDERRKVFFEAIDDAYTAYGNEHVLDLYVICFSVHKPGDQDGILSMWRGYGNQGKGAAIVFDTSRLPVANESPLALGPVTYATAESRKTMIANKVGEIAAFLESNHIPDDYVAAIASALFGRLCVFSVFSKHSGFLEENEWRLVYFIDRDQPDSDDARLRYERYFSYFNGPNGIQPKLKLPVGKLLSSLGGNVSFSDLIDSIIIGPTSASPIAKRTVERMLRDLGKGELVEKVRTSGIPFRG